MDSQGRISLPRRWRARKLQEPAEVVVVKKGDLLLVKPRVKPDLTRYFDAVSIDIDPEDFVDYARLKRALLGRYHR